MTETVDSIRNILKSYSEMLALLSEESFVRKPEDGKWSKKEELGHLIDSAHTNLRRFVVGQYEDSPKLTYEQEKWVHVLQYQHQPVRQLISLWTLLNEQICLVLEKMPAESQERICDTGKKVAELHSLKWLATDYEKHMLHHLHHILEMDAVPY